MGAQHLKKILVIDDSKDMRELMVILFEGAGYAVDTADGGDKALRALDTGEPPDLIFLDYRMENMDGLEFLLKFSIRYPQLKDRVKIIMITGHPVGDIKTERASEILQKPVGIKELLSIANGYLH